MEQFKLGSRYYYATLSTQNQIIYRKIYNQWSKGMSNAEIEIDTDEWEAYYGLSLHNLSERIIDDNPHLFHLETSNISYTRLNNKVGIEMEPLYTSKEYRKIYNDLIRVTKKILSSPVMQGSDIQKIKYLHDYLAETIIYGSEENDKKSTREAYTIVGALLKRKCVCSGYARAMRLLCDLSHISCIVVSGVGSDETSTGRHAWNIVKFNKGIYHIDVTWDSNLKQPNKAAQKYFLKSDEFFKHDHRWDYKFYPKCPSNY